MLLNERSYYNGHHRLVVARVPGSNPTLNFSILPTFIQCQLCARHAALGEKSLPFCEVLPRSWAVPGHQAQSRGLCCLLHSTLSALPTGRRDSEEDSNSGFWGALTYVAVGGGGCGRLKLRKVGWPGSWALPYHLLFLQGFWPWVCPLWASPPPASLPTRWQPR